MRPRCLTQESMKFFIAMWVLSMVGSAVESAAAARTYTPTGSPNSNADSIASLQGTLIEETLSKWVKITAVVLGVFFIGGWRIRGIIKNTEAWRNLNVLEGDPAEEDEVAAHRLLDNRPNSDLELTHRPIATPNPPASRDGMQREPGFPNLNDEGIQEASDFPPGTTYTRRVSTWNSSSMSIHVSHN